MSLTSHIADLVIKINYLRFTVATNQIDPDALMETVALIELYDNQLRQLQRQQIRETIQHDINLGRWTKLYHGIRCNLLHQTCILAHNSNT